MKIYYLYNIFFYNNFIHHGEFYLEKKISFIKFYEVISKPSNILNKITIIEGWSKKELNIELSKHFNNFSDIHFSDIFADTYYYSKNEDFNIFLQKLKLYKKEYFKDKNKNLFFRNYNENELMIIGSLIEKEGLDLKDKRLISSVIMNRLSSKMRLQIDATVLYSLTEGNFDLKRNLNFNDLKIDSPYNTYMIDGLPPNPISYVSKKTAEIILENYETDYLFYFFNNRLRRHIFSKTFNEHKTKLNDYRNKK